MPGGRLALWSFRIEGEGLQPVVGSVDHAAIFECDFRAEHSPVGRFGSTWLCHRYLLR